MIRGLGWLALLAAGCGPGKPVVYPTEATVTAGGKPAVGVTVFLHPAAAPAPAGGPPVARPLGTTGPDGVVRFTTFDAYDGAPPGDYVVTLLFEPVPSLEKSKPVKVSVPKELTDPGTSPLRATVGAKPANVLPAISLP